MRARPSTVTLSLVTSRASSPRAAVMHRHRCAATHSSVLYGCRAPADARDLSSATNSSPKRTHRTTTSSPAPATSRSRLPAGPLAASRRRLELDAAVLERDARRVAGHEEGRPAVCRGGVERRAAGGLAPREEEVAGGAPVGDGVVHGVADGEGSEREPGKLDKQQLLGAVAVRVQAQHLGAPAPSA